MENTNSWSNASRPFNGYNQTFASQTPAKGSKGRKILFYAGLVFIAGSLVIGGAAFYNYLYGEKTKTYTLTATITDTAEEDGELFSLSEYGLSEEATPEEVENKMIELGLFDPNADYFGGEDADMDSESYCGDGSCNKLALRKEVSVSVGDSVFNGYTEKGVNFII